jgi:alpha-2-macroglobulin
MSMSRLGPPVTVSILALAAVSCPGPRIGEPGAKGTPAAAAPAAKLAAGLTIIDTDQPGLTFKLSEGVEGADQRRPSPPAKTTPLSDAEAQRVLARLPAMTVDPDDRKEFALRERSLPAPRTGQTIQAPFPPPPSAPPADAGEPGPLEVVRHMPDGDVPLAPHVSLTFSQPMVPVTSHAELEKLPVPARLTPQPPGRWRWVGAKTLLFEPLAPAEPGADGGTATGTGAGSPAGTPGRFPMATAYTVEVPAGTRSQTGGTLDKPFVATFTTPTVQVKAFLPHGGPVRRDPVMLLAFDQKIDPQAVLATISVKAAGTSFPLRLATQDEIKADEAVKDQIAALDADAQKGRYLAFRAVDKLPVDSKVTVSVGPGTPSLEGPRKSEKAKELGFRTYGPLRVTRQNCQNQEHACPPTTVFELQFSNPLDEKRFHREMVKVEPEIKEMKLVPSGRELGIFGISKGHTTYRVTLSGSLPDAFGQTLEKDTPVEFVTGGAPGNLFAMGGPFVVLDPVAGPRFSVYSVNQRSLKVHAWKYGPERWNEWHKYLREVWSREQWPPLPPGPQAIDETVTVKGPDDEIVETRIDLTRALTDGRGSVVLLVEPAVRPRNRWEWSPILAWVQVTQIGLDAAVDHDELVGWATSLSDGKPLEGVELGVAPSGLRGTTDASGTARLPLNQVAGQMLIARRGNDVAFLPDSTGYWSENGSWIRRDSPDTIRWYVADDRQMYKPGETVKLKGWLRKVGGGETGDVLGYAGVASKVDYVLRDSRGNQILKGEARVNAAGGFDTSFKLPDNMNLGYANLLFTAADAKLAGGSAGHRIQVQEFRRPEFEVAAQASAAPHLLGEHATVSVSASYYAGGGLANAETSWWVSTSPGSFSPPNRGDWTFGEQKSWWDYYVAGGRPEVENKDASFAAHTDSQGKHVLGIDFLAIVPPQPMNLTAQATVMDVNRQAWASSATLLVHPADRYVGLKSPKPYVQKGETIAVDAILTDLDGKAVAGQPIRVHAVRLDWDFTNGKYVPKEVDPQDCELRSSDKGERCSFKGNEGGMYQIVATIADDRGRPNRTVIKVWVAGGKLPPARDVAQEKLQLLPDKKEYHGGDTAEVLVIPPWSPAEALVTLRRAGIFRTERLSIAGSSATVKVKIEDGWTPNLTLQVDAVGAAPRVGDDGEVDAKLPKRPAFASGQIGLSIPPVSRKLTVAVIPRDEKLEPGGQTSVHVTLKDARGEPVAGGEVALVVVDEAVLSLTGYRLPDPLPTFYPHRGPDTADYHLRQNVVLAKPTELPSIEQGGGGGPGGGLRNGSGTGMGHAVPHKAMAPPPPPSPSAAAEKVPVGRAKMYTLDGLNEAKPTPDQAQAPIALRTNFDALAVFAPSVITDARGGAEVPVKLPDNLTRYRVMAVAVAGDRQFGGGEATITARKPIMVRPSPPRFLNFGDRFELPIVVQNQLDKPLDVDVAVRVANLELTAGNGRRVTVPANDRVEVRFPVAAMVAGTARFQVGIVATGGVAGSDAAEQQLPVWTPATTEAFATYGVIDKGAVTQAVKMPGEVFPQFGGLQITTASTNLQSLTDAVLYLMRYPYECSEQMASRLMSVAALKDVLGAFHADGLPKPEAMIASVAKDVEMLRRLQNYDGGWGFWKHGEASWPFLTAHVVHALARAKEKGFAVPQAMLDQAAPYLRDIERHIPAWYGPEARRALIGYSLYVRLRLGDRDLAKARRLVAEAGGVDKLPLEALGWVYPVFSGDPGAKDVVEQIRRFLANRVEETAGAAHFATSYGDGAYLLLHSDRRVDALFLEGMIADQPKSDLIPKLVEGLLGHRTAGRWQSTQESAWVLLALDKYFNTYEKVTPDFVARAWLGDRFAGDHAFKGYSTDRYAIDVPMKWLADHAKGGASGTEDLILQKDGAGRLYYRIGMDYAPRSLVMPPRDNGFTVEREYQAVDDKADVRRDPDGTWHVKAGARVRVRLTMVVPTRRYHVALVDPIPAGLEPMNPALATTGVVPQDPKAREAQGARWWWSGPWYEHQNLRDERVEAFASLVWEGVHTYSYVARATTPGTFVVPPTKAEEMYHPETFGRAAGDKVIVE